jgi:hypothetical protein
MRQLVSIKEAAVALGVSHQTIYNRLRETGCKIKYFPNPERNNLPGLDLEQLRSVFAKRHPTGRKRREWTPAELKIIKQGIADDLSSAKIVRAVDVLHFRGGTKPPSGTAIRNKISELKGSVQNVEEREPTAGGGCGAPCPCPGEELPSAGSGAVRACDVGDDGRLRGERAGEDVAS